MHLYQKENIKTLIVSVFNESAGPGGVRRLHKYHIWYFDHIFQILDTEDVPVKHIIPCLPLSQKSENDIANIKKKKQLNFVRKTNIYLKKTPNNLEKLHRDFSKEGKKERQLGMWVFHANI